MGLIQAVAGAVSSTMRDQWLEYISCDSLSDDILFAKGVRHHSKGNHNKGNEDIITKDSVIAVADGQCMVIVEDGMVLDYCTVPGAYKFDQSSEIGLFSGNLGQGIKETFKTMGRRIAFGGDTGKSQWVYYMNIKEVKNNLFGTPSPVPFKVEDKDLGFKLTTTVQCSGSYTYFISNPALFYKNVCGNVSHSFDRSEINTQLKAEFVAALIPAFGKLSALKIDPTEIGAHTPELTDALNEALAEKWANLRGISIASVAITTCRIPDADIAKIQKLQETTMYSNAAFAAGALAQAQAQATVDAANNSAGAMTGFMGMNMAAQAGGINAQNLFNMGQQQAAAAQQAAPSAGSWTCECGTVNTGKFCSECAKPKPAPAGSWTCECGTVNTGKFCSECAKPKPSADWTCECGTVNTGKFCSECAKPRP